MVRIACSASGRGKRILIIHGDFDARSGAGFIDTRFHALGGFGVKHGMLMASYARSTVMDVKIIPDSMTDHRFARSLCQTMHSA